MPRAVQYTVACACSQLGPRPAGIYQCEKDAALALNASALEEALQILRAAFVSAG